MNPLNITTQKQEKLWRYFVEYDDVSETESEEQSTFLKKTSKKSDSDKSRKLSGKIKPIYKSQMVLPEDIPDVEEPNTLDYIDNIGAPELNVYEKAPRKEMKIEKAFEYTIVQKEKKKSNVHFKRDHGKTEL